MSIVNNLPNNIFPKQKVLKYEWAGKKRVLKKLYLMLISHFLLGSWDIKVPLTCKSYSCIHCPLDGIITCCKIRNVVELIILTKVTCNCVCGCIYPMTQNKERKKQFNFIISKIFMISKCCNLLHRCIPFVISISNNYLYLMNNNMNGSFERTKWNVYNLNNSFV